MVAAGIHTHTHNTHTSAPIPQTQHTQTHGLELTIGVHIGLVGTYALVRAFFSLIFKLLSSYSTAVTLPIAVGGPRVLRSQFSQPTALGKWRAASCKEHRGMRYEH